jgi:hypothetical protein
VSVVGSAPSTVVSHNVVSGSGSSAIDTARATVEVVRTANVDDGWNNTTSILERARNALLQPMSLLWLAISVLVIGSMIRGLRGSPPVRGRHPYAHQNSHLQPGLT